MIRLIKLDDQISENTREFAFYDTVVDKFVTIGDDQTWTNVQSLLDSFAFESPENVERLQRRLVSHARSAGYPEDRIDGRQLI